jgi:hypothetical protein
MILIRIFLICCALLSAVSSRAMIYDNRWFPWYKSPYSRTKEKQSRIYGGPFIVMAHKAANDGLDEDHRLFEVFGRYDENQVRQAIIDIGGPDFFDTPALQVFKGREVIWRMSSKLSGQGVAVVYDQRISKYLSVGCSFFFMHLFSRILFKLSKHIETTVTDDQEQALDIARRAMNQFLHIEAPVQDRTGMSDFECYLRLGNVWDYTWKCRRIDAGLRVGAILPSGLSRTINNPASLPFGGNGLWGVYVAGDAQLELKEDWSVGLLAQYNQRFSRVQTMRLPVAQEQQLFGALVGPVLIHPDLTLIVAPYAQLEGIRDGLGLRAQYTAVWHFKDMFTDFRSPPQPPAMITPLIKRSDWVAEYITLDAFYDFAKVWQDESNALLLTAKVDVPINWLVGEQAAKTVRLSFGIQLTY